MSPTYDFQTSVDRSHTGSLKWDRYPEGVLPFWVADMDFRSAPEIVDALRKRVDHGVYGYTLPPAETVEATLKYLSERHSIEAEAEHLVWLPGLVPALNVVARAYAQGGEVLTCTPVYPPFLSAPDNQSAALRTVSLTLENDRWTFDWDALEAAVSPATKVFLLCQPHNPVGRVYDVEEMTRLGEFCARHDLVLISDEIHCDLILDDEVRHVPAATLSDELTNRTVTLLSPSKTYNLPGLACAYAIIPNGRLRVAFKQAAQGMITEVNCFGYTGCAAAYTHGEPWRQELIRTLRANRDRLYSFVAERLPEVRIRPMAATYLAWLDISTLGLDNALEHFVQHGLGLSPGRDFGDPSYLRLNFGCPASLLEEGLERLEAGVVAARV